MNTRIDPFPILLADDDLEDVELTREAFELTRVTNPLHSVRDGQEVLDFLRHKNGFNPENAPRPGLILLDLNMPRMSGVEALAAIKSDPAFRRIPVVILTTSKAEEDVVRTYDLGAASYITKPVTFDALVDAVQNLKEYWVELVVFAPELDPR